MHQPARIVDPRVLQILTLSSLLTYGLSVLSFDLRFQQAAVIITTSLAAQYLCSRWYGLPRFEPKSALISALSLCLLLRTNELWLYAAGAMLAICSKFLVRVHGKHLWNPTNFGIAVLILCGLPAWVSPGQWGTEAIVVAGAACAGALVLYRAERSDVTIAFIGSYAAMLFARALWLGDPLEIPLHQLESGSLLIFSFFMISDPKTTPDARVARIIFAVCTAALAYYIRFKLFSPNALILALFFSAPLVPVLDRIFRSLRYYWPDEERRGSGGVPSRTPPTGQAVEAV